MKRFIQSSNSTQAEGSFNKTTLQEFYKFALRKQVYDDFALLQKDLDDWLD